MACQPQIFGCGRFGINLRHDPFRRIRAGNYHLPVARPIMLRLEHMYRPARGQDGNDRRAGVKVPAIEYRGLAKGQVVARRPADQRNIAQGVLDRHGQQFFAMRQAVHQEQRDMIDALAQRPAVAFRPCRKRAHLFAGGLGIEIIDVVETMGRHAEAVGGKADDGQAVAVITIAGQFPRTGAADHRHTLAMPIDRPRQPVAIIAVRAKDHGPGQRLCAQRLAQFCHGLERIIGMGAGKPYPRLQDVCRRLAPHPAALSSLWQYHAQG